MLAQTALIDIHIQTVMKKQIVCFHSARSLSLSKGWQSDERRQTKNTLQSGKSIAAIYISGKIIDRVGKTDEHSHLSLIFHRRDIYHSRCL